MSAEHTPPAGDLPAGSGRAPLDRPAYGFPRRWWTFLAEHPPPGAATINRRWRSPLRGPWLTSVYGLALLVGLPLVFLTGLLDYLAYSPQFGQAFPGDVGWLRLPPFDWPTRPSWLFRLTQGLHVGLGITLIPIVLAKLWSVLPKLFDWPPARSVAQVLERLSLLLLVGGILFEIATGLLDIQYAYLFGFDFYTAHYFGAWVFVAALVVHVSLRLGRMRTALRARSLGRELATPRPATRAEPPDPDRLVAARPGPATMSRRGALALVGGLSLLVAALTVGQHFDGPWRRTALLLPRGRQPGTGPTGFPINRTAAAAGVGAADTGPGWRLTLRSGGHSVTVDRPGLLAMAQHTVTLPIACVEGWSTVQTWTGVRLRDLAALVGADGITAAHVRSLEKAGLFRQAALQANQVLDPDSLLALRVNGVDLTLDHGYPARVIVPALPGVHCTKWVTEIEFRGRAGG
ncbi:sulfoxide reductase catalytic subunit YedY [Micromonospora viridifaciens]|uniref:Sulfoxide reductase catalytic subunit YedY n=1 Tax=Micromonospora viridifaciens TaxID=1881 RepID=A0A1C4XMY5_MICVI|nr:molybdopterin-dependent oxidoreductase [Micromonospora viridifaciens]SCF09880.1 sulfoxide reductase catalytic subunit YedY [Micromonospora viridifaciens]